jgi:hypothetical protein
MNADRMTSSIRPAHGRPVSPLLNRRPGAAGLTPVKPPVHSPRTDQNLHSIVLVDVVASAARDGQGQRRMRDDLYEIMTDVIADNGLDLESLPFEDRGDGLRLIVPLDLIRPTRVVDFFVAGLAAALREHRRYVSEVARIRMRVCFDLGLVELHRRGWTGDPLVRAARLIDASQLREALDAEPEADLAVVVSDMMFDSIVRHRFGQIPPDCFDEIRVQVKEFDGRAWLFIPRAVGMCHRCAYR